MPQSIRDKTHTVHRNVDDAIEGDLILIECRKPGKRGWQTSRASGQHNYFTTAVRKNAYAVLTKTFTNLQK